MNLLKNKLKIDPANEDKTSDIESSDASQAGKVESSSSIMHKNYTLVEVEVAENPVGDDGEDWHRYVLVRGYSRITGYHRGTLSEVTRYANDCAEHINERNSYRSKRPVVQTK